MKYYMKKFIPLIFLLIWSITLVLILTFATDVAVFITDTLSSVYHIYIDSVDVEDINLNLQSDYKPNRYYSLQYEVKTKENKYTTVDNPNYIVLRAYRKKGYHLLHIAAPNI